MFLQSVRRAGVLVVAVAAIGVLGGTSAASADAGPVDVSTTSVGAVEEVGAPAPGEVGARASALVTYDKYITEGLWRASSVGVVAAATYCAIQPIDLMRSVCAFIIRNMFGTFRALGPPNGRCLNVNPRFGWPPYRLHYSSC